MGYVFCFDYSYCMRYNVQQFIKLTMIVKDLSIVYGNAFKEFVCIFISEFKFPTNDETMKFLLSEA